MKNLKKEKNNLIKSFNNLVKDIMDNYEKYTDLERQEIENLFNQFETLNTKLDKYDIKSSLFKKFSNAFNNFFKNN